MSWLIPVGLALFAALATHALLRWGVPWLARQGMMDQPSPRGLHAQPVPRGGGAAFATVVLGVHAIAMLAGVAPSAGLAGWCAVAAYAVLGWWDDRRSVPARWRLLVQVAIAAALLSSAPPSLLASGWPAQPLAVLVLGAGCVLALVWAVNLYNFMDGADGYAGSAAICIALPIAVPAALADAGWDAALAATLAGACAGFLAWNWPPAKVFMGDAGSYFLGAQFAVLALYGAPDGLVVWLVLAAPFVTDASLTLVARLARGAHPARAHREHAYQRLRLAGWSARRLVAALVLLYLCWYWPLAVLVQQRMLAAPLALLGAYGLAVMIWTRARSLRPVDT